MQDSKDDPKAGADVGKIVNLMAVDASKVPRCLIRKRPTFADQLLWNVDGANGIRGIFHLWRCPV